MTDRPESTGTRLLGRISTHNIKVRGSVFAGSTDGETVVTEGDTVLCRWGK